MNVTAAADRLAKISQWIDDFQGDRDPEATTWGRIAKIGEEYGETITAYIAYTGQNPRKDWGQIDDVKKELLDVAVAALGAYEHLTGNNGMVMPALVEQIDHVYNRAGIEEQTGATPKAKEDEKEESTPFSLDDLFKFLNGETEDAEPVTPEPEPETDEPNMLYGWRFKNKPDEIFRCPDARSARLAAGISNVIATLVPSFEAEVMKKPDCGCC